MLGDFSILTIPLLCTLKSLWVNHGVVPKNKWFHITGTLADSHIVLQLLKQRTTLVIRHDQELNLQRRSDSFVMFFTKPEGVLAILMKEALNWHQLETAFQCVGGTAGQDQVFRVVPWAEHCWTWGRGSGHGTNSEKNLRFSSCASHLLSGNKPYSLYIYIYFLDS